MTDRELMQQALDALEADEHDMVPDQEGHMVFRKGAAITALNERLAQPEQEQWDAIPAAFNEWWNADYDDTGNPYRKDNPAYWAWSGWKAASKQPEQEPVAWMVYTQEGQSVYVTDNPTDLQESQRALPLYTTPPQRKPLSDEWIHRTTILMGFNPEWTTEIGIAYAIVRAAEAAHNIKEKNNGT